MKKYVKSSYYQEDEGGLKREVHHIVAKMINNPNEHKLYGKIMNVKNEAKLSYIEALLDFAEIFSIDVPNLNDLYELMSMEGVDAVVKAMRG